MMNSCGVSTGNAAVGVGYGIVCRLKDRAGSKVVGDEIGTEMLRGLVTTSGKTNTANWEASCLYCLLC